MGSTSIGAVDFSNVYQQIPALRPSQPGIAPAVRFEAASPSASADISGIARRYATNEPTIEAMFDSTVTAEQRQHVQRDLGVLPPSLLTSAQEAGMRIWVANSGDTEVPARLYPPDGTDPARAAQSHDRFGRSFGRFLEQAGEVEKKLMQDPAWVRDAADITGRGKPDEAGMRQFMTARQKALVRNGLTEPSPPTPPPQTSLQWAAPRGTPQPPEIAKFGLARPPQEGDTLEDAARLHGASTPEQIKEYADLAGRLNYQDGAPRKAQTPLKAGEGVLLPEHYYYQGQRFSQDTRARIGAMNDGLRNPDVRGTTVFMDRLLMVKAEDLPDPAPDGPYRVVTHEMGHVAEKLMLADPTQGQRHIDRSTAAYTEGMQRYHAPHSEGAEFPLITGYSTDSPQEHYAEAFEAYHTQTRRDGLHQPSLGSRQLRDDANYDDLKRKEPTYFDLLDTEMGMWERGEVRPVLPRR